MSETHDERAPLLGSEDGQRRYPASTYYRILICGFIISLAVAFTWVPMIYTFRVMSCDEYYDSHPPYEGTGDKCGVSDIEAETARSVSLLGTTTTIFGVVNLLVSGWSVKRFGPKMALIQQTVFPALRLMIQVVGVKTGHAKGKLIVQCSQLICTLGGPAGYLLVTNAFIAEVVEAAERTKAFGALQGCVMFGTAFGYIVGGLVGDIFGISKPYETAFYLMLIATAYSAIFLPRSTPSKVASSDVNTSPEKAKRSLGDYLGPLRMFAPQTYELPNGKRTKHFGRFFLGAGVFLGVLATGFIPVLIQMYATDVFGFRPTENGYLMALNSLIRGGFLTFAFPFIITRGRAWFASRNKTPGLPNNARVSAPPATSAPTIPVQGEDFEPSLPLQAEQEPIQLPVTVDQSAGSAFDLFFLRWSLVADGVLTASAGLSRTGWQIYLASCLLPLASGSAAAAKGTMMDMCDPTQRTDALSAITLVEMVATLSTMSIFGAIFALLAEKGIPHVVFFCNGGLAMVAVLVLIFCRMPPTTLKRVDV